MALKLALLHKLLEISIKKIVLALYSVVLANINWVNTQV